MVINYHFFKLEAADLAVFFDVMQHYANASGLFRCAREAREIIESARDTVAAQLNASSENIIFCSSGTEANNQVIQQLIHKKVILKQPCHVIVSSIEHSSVKNAALYLKPFGIELDFCPVGADGRLDLDAYKALFKPHTSLVSLIYANNEIGSIQPVKEAVLIAKEHGALTHSDAVQAFGKCKLDVQALGLDFLTVSAHKIYGPKGAAALYVNDDDTLSPLIHGGGHERQLRAGTENVLAIAGFAAACEQIDVPRYQAHTLGLKQRFKQGLLETLDAIQFNDTNSGISNTVSLTVKGVDGLNLAINLDLDGICVSTGSACSTGSREPSHVLSAIGLSDDLNKSTLRFSFGLSNTNADIDTAVSRVTDIVTRMRAK